MKPSLLVCVLENSPNPYIKEIYNKIQLSFNTVFSRKEFWQDKDFDIIHIHWPEELFNYRETSTKDITLFTKRINYWKYKGSKIIFTRHNYKPHNNNSSSAMYDFLIENSDAIIHLGINSLINSFDLDKIKQVVIPHHIYTSYPKRYSKQQSRFNLKLDKNAVVILIPGTIRNIKEIKFIYNATKGLNIDNLKIIIQRWPKTYLYQYLKTPHKVFVKYFYYILLRYIHNYKIHKGFINDELLSQLFIASDIVLIPRIKGELNSGNVFLSLFYNRRIIGPDSGNISEIIDESGNYKFNSIKAAKTAVKIALTEDKTYVLSDNCKEKWSLKNCVNAHLNLYHELLNF